MSQPTQSSLALKEAKIQLAKRAIDRDQIHSNRRTAKTFNVSDRILRRRRAGISSRRDYISNSRLLIDIEKNILIKYILNLDSRDFTLFLYIIRDMANSILTGRSSRQVEKN